MDEFEDVLCFCPGSRLPLLSWVLTTWTGVRRFVVTEDDTRVADVDGFSAVIVMDRFVTRPIVEQLAARLPVIVMAWNGLFDISRYRQALGELDVIYMGTDQTLRSDAWAPIRYLPLINGSCTFARWRELHRDRRQFTVEGNPAYRLRLLRTSILPPRSLRVLVSAAGSLRHPRVLRRTLESALVRDKLVWAGNCYLDFRGIGLTEIEQKAIQTMMEAARAKSTPAGRLSASLELIQEWRALAGSAFAPERRHAVFYVTNTLLRWAVLSFLSASAKSSTWFFGRDNLGLGLEVELYVHNLVTNDRVAFLEFGGKTSEAELYPRALHLLAREFYVIAISLASEGDPFGEVMMTVDRIVAGVTERPREFFRELEDRRRTLYQNLPRGCELRDVQKRVWSDFAHIHQS